MVPDKLHVVRCIRITYAYYVYDTYTQRKSQLILIYSRLFRKGQISGGVYLGLFSINPELVDGWSVVPSSPFLKNKPPNSIQHI